MFKKTIFSLILLTSFLFAGYSFAADSFDQIVNPDGTMPAATTNNSTSIINGTGISEKATVPGMIGTAIQITLGFFGAIALFFIIWGGFGWMMSQGDPKKISEARNRMITAVIGMFIIATSYAITDFVMSQISVIAS